MGFRSGRRVALSCLTMLTCEIMYGASAHAQAYDRVSPQVPQSQVKHDVIKPPAAVSKMPSSNVTIIPSLNGIIVLGSQKSVSKSRDDHGVVVEGGSGPVSNNDISDLKKLLAAFIGKKASLNTLNQIGNVISAFYQKSGFPFVLVTIPPQSLRSGSVQIVVSEYHLGSVKVQSNKWFSSASLTRQFGMKKGSRLSLDDIQDRIGVINSNPFRTVNAIFSPGASPGYTDVTLQTEDRLPLSMHGGYDTYGTPTLGREEWSIGGSYGNVLGSSSVVSYEFTHSSKDLYSSHAVSMSIPLPWRDRIEVFGVYAWEHPRGQYVETPLNETGHSAQASIRYVHDLGVVTLGQHMRLSHEVRVGFDYKQTNNAIEFGGLQVYAGNAETEQFLVGYHALLTDQWGQTTVDNQITLSPGNMSSGNKKANYQQFILYSKPSYVYDTFALNRLTWIPYGMSLVTQVSGQISSSNLMYSNQLGLGGMRFARGYFTDTAMGSNGVALSMQLNSPTLHIKDGWDTEQAGVFFDYGYVSQVKRTPNGLNSATLGSVGIDLHAQLREYINIGFNVGWRLMPTPVSRQVSGYGNEGGFGNVTISLGF